MLIISHRGNLEGRDPATENTVEQVQKALDLGFDVEVDVWWVNGDFFLGHDTPDEQVLPEYLANEHLWCHAKNVEALEHMLERPDIHCFVHDRDKYAATSQGYIWTAVRSSAGNRVVVVANDMTHTDDVYGICTDYPRRLEWDTGSDE